MVALTVPQPGRSRPCRSRQLLNPINLMQSEVEVQEAVVDLVMGPAEERETNTHHTVAAEEEHILRCAVLAC